MTVLLRTGWSDSGPEVRSAIAVAIAAVESELVVEVVDVAAVERGPEAVADASADVVVVVEVAGFAGFGSLHRSPKARKLVAVAEVGAEERNSLACRLAVVAVVAVMEQSCHGVAQRLAVFAVGSPTFVLVVEDVAVAEVEAVRIRPVFAGARIRTGVALGVLDGAGSP